jgi:hypothetical protein
MQGRVKEQIRELKRYGITLLGLAASLTLVSYILPHDETHYWLSHEGKRGMYVLSAFFVFLGFYCLGAVWRRKNFI